MRTDQMALLIPIIVAVLGLSIPLLMVLSKYLRRRHLAEVYHRERMAAIDKGIEIPGLPEALLRESYGRGVTKPGAALLRGLIWTFGGLSLFYALRQENIPGASFAF